jgi:hypothetical protein
MKEGVGDNTLCGRNAEVSCVSLFAFSFTCIFDNISSFWPFFVQAHQALVEEFFNWVCAGLGCKEQPSRGICLSVVVVYSPPPWAILASQL